jgi:putative ABC transport system ATP-binding protein
MENIIIRSEKIRKEYLSDNMQSICIIPGLDLEVKKGEFVVIMGNSGSGKSTLLYLLSGLEILTGGRVYIKNTSMPAGQKEKALLRRQNMGFVFQQSNLIPGLTLLENILVVAYLNNKDRSSAREKSLSLMRYLEIDRLKDRFPDQVSGGEQQRCAIARAIVNSPGILFADEPTGNLNSASTENVLRIFSELNAKGQTIIMVTHSVESACYGERIVYLHDGRIVDEYPLTRKFPKHISETKLLKWLTDKGW